MSSRTHALGFCVSGFSECVNYNLITARGIAMVILRRLCLGLTSLRLSGAVKGYGLFRTLGLLRCTVLMSLHTVSKFMGETDNACHMIRYVSYRSQYGFSIIEKP